jgi:RNA polymerase sigma factor (sigma-70 family)
MSNITDEKLKHPIKVSIIDDDKTYIDSLKKKLFTDDTRLRLYEVYYTGRNFIQSLNSPFQPDVCLLDLVLNDMHGIECCKQVKEKRPGIHIILMTSYPSLDSILKIRSMGADYIEKGERIESIIEHIIKSYNKSGSERIISLQENSFADIKNMELISEIEKLKVAMTKLTDRQREIFKLKKEGKTREEIAELLGISKSTVNTQINRAYSKINLPNILEYLFE